MAAISAGVLSRVVIVPARSILEIRVLLPDNGWNDGKRVSEPSDGELI